jgi:ribosomal protein S8
LIDDVIGQRVKRDYQTKISCLCAGLSAYTPEPMNVYLKEQSSSGKTYNAVNSLRIFPEEDVWSLGKLSPTALVHLHGTLLDANGHAILDTEAPQKNRYDDAKDYQQAVQAWRERLRGSYTLIDLSGKILLFLDNPDLRTLQMLYPILSHDKREVEYRITDKTSCGQLRTRRTVIRGWPATIFCTTDSKFIEELATRMFTTAPEVSTGKIRDAHRVSGLMKAAPWEVDAWTVTEQAVQDFIRNYKAYMQSVAGVVIPYAQQLAEVYPAELRRDMRDLPHFMRLIQALSALHFMQRPHLTVHGKQYIAATLTDLENARRIFTRIYETTRSSIKQSLLDFYWHIIATRDTWTLKELTAAYNETHQPSRSSKTVERYLNELADHGYVDIQKDEKDKRRNLYVPLKEKRTIPDIFKISIISPSDYETGLNAWLSRNRHQLQFLLYNSSTLTDSSGDAFLNAIRTVNDDALCLYWEMPGNSHVHETKPGKTDKSEMSTIVHNSHAPTTFDRIEAYVQQATSVGCLRAAQDLAIPLKDFHEIGSTSRNLQFDQSYTTVSWRPYYDAFIDQQYPEGQQ